MKRAHPTGKRNVVGIASDFVRGNMIYAVLTGLLTSWLTISWVVCQIEKDADGANITSFGQALWWGAVTCLTVGYGDLYPVTVAGKIWAGLLMVCGVFCIAIITSKISSYFLEQALREGRGVVDTDKLKDHFIVCGWKEEMHELLIHILDFNPGMNARELVMIANVGQPAIDALKEHPRLKGLHVIVGPYFEVASLKRAAPERAKKVLILADRTPDGSGKPAGMTECDARTIMTAMTLSNVARGTLVTAEVLDPKMDQYLKLAGVSEIIYSREYSRLLLGNASGGTGISNIIFDLLDPRTPARIQTRPVETHVGATYAAFKREFEARNPASTVVGILEHTGNTHQIKELALRQAQKTPDMLRLLENLRSVKGIRCNQPVFNPAADYVVTEGSMAIVIESVDLGETAKGRETADAGAQATFARGA